MYSAETTIVDVKQTGESEYTLSMTAKELYVAAQSGDVIRRHDVSASDKAPEKKYVALSGVKFAEATGKYTFTFASGDVMETTSADAYPTSESISDSTGGSGGRFVVTFTYDESTETWSTDKTFAECVAAWEAGKNLFALESGIYYTMSSVATESDEVTYISFCIADAETQTISGYAIDAEGAYYYAGGE